MEPAPRAPEAGKTGPFPSLGVRRDALEPRGAFAEAQAAFLRPDPATVTRLDALLEATGMGVVAHFYMDPELQGVLSACRSPHIHISESLLMADHAVAMAEAGVRGVLVLGVDFMSENVRAMLDASGYGDLPVYRLAAQPIGCSLAEAAEAAAYGAWLAEAAHTPHSLHVIYINTSLRVKAKAHHIVPTVTCTSSNVVKLILTAFAEVQGLNVWFGPDTYMGENLRSLFRTLSTLDDDSIRSVHPAHDRASVRSLLERFHYFEQGNCIVHHMFGADVARTVRERYPNAFVTAHLEVPGEMFALGMEGHKEGRGVVGSTSNILSFITDRVSSAATSGKPSRLQFVLGTEAGMVTSIVRNVQSALAEHPESPVEAEIVFPVASEAMTAEPGTELGMVPGASGEGCSVAGGCATCPYMKMNSLDALFRVLHHVDAGETATLAAYAPKSYAETVDGRTLADVGGEPILHMRHFQRTGHLPDALVRAVGP